MKAVVALMLAVVVVGGEAFFLENIVRNNRAKTFWQDLWSKWSQDNDNVMYFLSTRKSQNERLHNNNQLKEDAKNFNPKAMTYFFIHGWLTKDDGSTIAPELSVELLKKKDVNVVFVNWKKWAFNLNYLEAKKRCDDVGRDIASFIKRLEGLGASRTRMHLIGFSLGGQVAGFAGAELQSPKVARITGLDTADIGFNCLFDKNNCLDPTDAEFVDEIHTLVSVTAKGHADFWPVHSDHWKLVSDDRLGGAHFLAPAYFLQSVRAGSCSFKSTACGNVKQFTDGKCSSNSQNHLGFYATKPTDGKRHAYFLDIDISKPCQ